MFLVAGVIGLVFLAGAGSALVFHPETLARGQADMKAFLIGMGMICAGTVVCFTSGASWRAAPEGREDGQLRPACC
jgi:hypothetical protein